MSSAQKLNKVSTELLSPTLKSKTILNSSKYDIDS